MNNTLNITNQQPKTTHRSNLLKTFTLATMIVLGGCSDDNKEPIPTPPDPTPKIANIANATITHKPAPQRVYKANEEIIIALTSKENFGNVELDIYKDGKLFKDNYQTDTNHDNKIHFTINPDDIVAEGHDASNIEYMVTDHKTEETFTQKKIHNNTMKTKTINAEF